MPYCPRCGVEVDPSVTQCPLCSTAVPRLVDLGPGEPAWPSPGHPDDPSAVYSPAPVTRRRLLGVVGVVALTAALVVAVVDLAIHGRLSWSWWPITSLAGTMALAAVFLIDLRQSLRGAAGFAVIAGLLAVFDGLDGPNSHWFWSLGFPIDVLVLGLVALGSLAWGRCRGADRVSLFLILVGGGLVGLDALIVAASGGAPSNRLPLSWSLITSVVLGALAALVFLLQRVLGSQRLERIFHW